VVTETGAGQIATPDNASLHVNVIVTLVLFHPFTGAGVMMGVTVGGVRSIFSVVVVLADCPAASVTVALMTWFAPSALTVCDPGHCSGGTPPLHA
jgi:hypothetical protein